MSTARGGSPCRTMAWLFSLIPSIGLADSPLDREATLADLSLTPHAMQLTLRLRESDLPAIRGGQPATCDLACVGRSLIKLHGPDGKRLAPLETLLTEAPTGEREHRVQIRQSYPLGTATERLVIEPGENTTYPALLVLQEGVAVSDRIRLNRPGKLALDWTNPWRSRFDQDNWRRHHLQPRSYIYVEPHEIRHEWLQPLVALPPALRQTAGLNNMRLIEPAERQPLLERLTASLIEAQHLEIDGLPAVPAVDRVIFVHQTSAGTEPVPPDETVPAHAAQLGIMLSYPPGKPASQFRLDWQLFSPGEVVHEIQVIRRQESLDAEVTPSHPQLDWSPEDMLDSPKPVAENDKPLTGNGGPAPDLGKLLLTAYQAFSIREEESAYDGLALSLVPPLLDQVYLDQRRALIRKARGLGGDSQVQRVELTALETLDSEPASRRIDASWVAHGQVSHWGHAHERHTRYRALVTLIRQDDGTWKIGHLDFIDGQGLDAA